MSTALNGIDQEKWFNVIKYHPHPRQVEFHRSQARFRIPCCGRRFGKSTMAARDLEPRLFVPKQRFWGVGPTYDLGEKEFRVVWDDLIVQRQFGRDKRVKKAYNKRSGEMFIEFPWQTRFEIRSADHPEGLVGDALNGVIMAEAAKHKHETWERYIRPALADYHGWATFPTTPEGHNWLYDLWQIGMDPNVNAYESWRFPSWENPYVYPDGRDDEEILLLERTTTPEWFAQEIGADFASFVGKIYAEFDEMKHVVDAPFHPEWPNYIFFDWGFVNPLAAIEVQISPMDDIYIWREHYKAYQTLDLHVAEMKARDQPPSYHLDVAYGDAADPEAAEYISAHFVGCYAMPEAKENWRDGVDLVKTFLRPYQVGEADEYGTPKTRPKLFVDRRCTNTIREFQTYRAREPTKVKAASEIGRQIDDHAMDAIRYGLVHIYRLGARHHLSEVYTKSDLAVNEEVTERGYFSSSGMVF